MRRMLITFAAIGLCLAASACGGDDDDDASADSGSDGQSQTEETSGSGDAEAFTDDDRTQFMDNCLASGGDDATCSCTWDAVVDNLSHDQYVAMEGDVTQADAAEMPPGFMQDIAACMM